MKPVLLGLGGAYAALPYLVQGGVETYGWLTDPQMIDGLALGETTLGPHPPSAEVPLPGSDSLAIIAIVYAGVEVLGVAAALRPNMTARTSERAVAWAIGLVASPWIALPLYGVFCGRRFRGYVATRRRGDGDADIQRLAAKIGLSLPREMLAQPPNFSPRRARVAGTLSDCMCSLAGFSPYIITPPPAWTTCSVTHLNPVFRTVNVLVQEVCYARKSGLGKRPFSQTDYGPNS